MVLGLRGKGGWAPAFRALTIAMGSHDRQTTPCLISPSTTLQNLDGPKVNLLPVPHHPFVAGGLTCAQAQLCGDSLLRKDELLSPEGCEWALGPTCWDMLRGFFL